MGRSKKNETAKIEEPVVNVEIEVGEEANPSDNQSATETQAVGDMEETDKTPTKDIQVDEISPRDAELMRLYPQYEEIWITSKGFVHPKGVPEYLLKDAKLFKNKYFNK